MKNTPRKVSFRTAICLLALMMAGPVFAQNSSEKKVKTSTQEKDWGHNQTNSPFSAFNSWAIRFHESSENSKPEMVAEGVRLAGKRREILARMAKTRPETVVAETVPDAIRRELPKAVADTLETRVSGIGDFTVLGYLAAKGGPAVEPIQRKVQLNGKTYMASTYGRRASQTSRKGIPLNGVVIDGILVLDENSIREVNASELSPEAAIIDLRTGAQKADASLTPVIGQVGGKYYRFASHAELQEAEARLEAAESENSPSPSQSVEQALQNTAPAGRGTAGNPPSAWTTGLKKVLYIRVDFPDLAGDPVEIYGGPTYTAAYVQNLADTQVTPFYDKSSYGLTSISNIVTTKLYRMPQNSTAYATTGSGNDQLHTDAETAAAADYTLTDYDRIVVLFQNLGSIPNSYITYGGLAELTGRKVWINGEFDFRVVTHELGHTYGLFHAGIWQVNDNNPISPNGFVIEYGDDFDTMGANYANDRRTDFNPYYKNILGWIPDYKVQTTGTNGVYRLYAFDQPSATNHPILALKFQKDSQRTYWVGVRRSFTNNPTMQNGAYMIWGYNSPAAGAGTGGGFLSALLDLNTPGYSPSANVSSDYDAALDIGSNFTDPAVNFSITAAGGDNSITNGYVDFIIGNGGFLQIVTNIISGGNGNGIIDFNECNNLEVVLKNSGSLVTNISATLSTTTPEVIIAQPFSLYPSLAGGEQASNLNPFKISTTPSFVCGTPIRLALVVQADAEIRTNFFTLASGSLGAPVQYSNTTTVAIPDANPMGIDSPIVVSNFNGSIGKVTVGLYLTHTFDFDLQLQLIAPDGTAVTLSRNNGGAGHNYGAGCSPASLRTYFDDAAPTSISSASAPFVGTFQPTEPLSAFNLKSSANANGTWKLRVIDQLSGDTGALQCWSLNLTPQLCTDGGGECPGSDLAVTMTAAPAPAVVSGNLTYTITVTNYGPGSAKAVTLTQLLPANSTFVTASASQGNIHQSGGVLTCNFGKIAARGGATATVVVSPTAVGTISSSATVSSEQPDANPSNNNVVVTTSVVPPSADLGVTVVDSPRPVGVGSILTYSINVTNYGPISATGVKLTNSLPATASFVSASLSQGTFVNNGGTIVCDLGTITNRGGAVVTIKVRPTMVGTVSMTARVKSNEADLLPENNVATVTTTVTPAADLALSLVANPQSVVVGSNVNYFITITNRGPSAANGVVIKGMLPMAGYITNDLSQGNFVLNGSSFTAQIGTLAANGAASLIVKMTAPVQPDVLTFTANVSASEADPDLANNSASISVPVNAPFTSIIAAGSRLTAESFATNGVIDVGETVSVEFSLQNKGNVNTTNLIATLLAGNGISDPSNPVSYGALAANGAAVSRTFSFTANGTNGQVITATLRVKDGSGPASDIAFTFVLPSLNTFSNTNGIIIPLVGKASPYPSQITVSNLTGLVTKVTATLNRMNHTYPHDIEVLLVDPTGRKVVLMNNTGGGNKVVDVTLKFDPDAVDMLHEFDQIVSATIRPGNFPPDPIFPDYYSGPYTTHLHSFDGTMPNGVWSLYVADSQDGDKGNIAGGWELSITTADPVNKVADLAVSASSIKGAVLTGEDDTYVFVVKNNGPDTASGVVMTNFIPTGAQLISSSQAYSQAGSAIVCNIGNLSSGNSVAITNVIRGTIPGTITNAAVVFATETDFNLSNNSASVIKNIGLPVADLGISLSATPSPVVGYDLVYSITVTNIGPNTANNVVVANPVPAGTVFVSASASQGAATTSAGVVTCSLGNIGAGSSASILITVTPLAPGSITDTATVVTASNDPNSANNTATLSSVVSNPFPIITASGASLISESASANGAIDPGETVMVSFALANVGTANTANLVATLKASGGVTAPSAPQAYGALISGGAAVSRSFSFTAQAASSGTITATLELQDGPNNLGTAVYTFSLPHRSSFTNKASISIPNSGPATPYPSTITVSGVSGLVSKVTVNLFGLSHTFPDDLDIMLLGPGGKKVMLMGDVGGGYAISGVNLTFDDSGAPMPQSGQIVSKTYRPTEYGPDYSLPSPAPAAPYAPVLAALNGGDANGVWSLYVNDDAVGDSGMILGGWSIDITTVDPVNPAADLAIMMTDSPRPAFVEGHLVYTMIVSNKGPATATGVVIIDTLPAGVRFVSATSSQGSSAFAGQTVSYNLGNIDSGGTAKATLTVKPNAQGETSNSASVTANELDLYTGNNTAQTTTPVWTAQPAVLGSASLLLNGDFQLILSGQAGLSYQIEVSSNLTTWIPVSTNIAAPNGMFKFNDSSAGEFNPRFYRAVRLP